MLTTSAYSLTVFTCLPALLIREITFFNLLFLTNTHVILCISCQVHLQPYLDTSHLIHSQLDFIPILFSVYLSLIHLSLLSLPVFPSFPLVWPVGAATSLLCKTAQTDHCTQRCPFEWSTGEGLPLLMSLQWSSNVSSFSRFLWEAIHASVISSAPSSFVCSIRHCLSNIIRDFISVIVVLLLTKASGAAYFSSYLSRWACVFTYG